MPCAFAMPSAASCFRFERCLSGRSPAWGWTRHWRSFCREERVWGPTPAWANAYGPEQPGPCLDALADGAYVNRDRGRLASIDLGGVRTFLIVPMLKDDELIGAMSIFRQELRSLH